MVNNMRCSKCGSNRLVKEGYIMSEVINNVKEKRKYTEIICLDCRHKENQIEVLDENK